MDYNKEVENLNQGSNTYKPSVGVHKVLIITEPVETEFKDEKTGDVTPQIRMEIESNGEQFAWFVGKGKTTGSLYGQLMYLGRAKGKLQGQLVTLMVTEIKQKDGSKRKSYTIQEVLSLMQTEQQQQQQANK